MVCHGIRDCLCVGRGFPDAPMAPLALDFVGRDDPARQTTLQTMNRSVTCKDGRDGSKTISFSLPEKERFLESKEKGAPVRVEWSQIGIRRPVFTPP